MRRELLWIVICPSAAHVMQIPLLAVVGASFTQRRHRALGSELECHFHHIDRP
jgi:hypothetical protein